MTKEAIFVRKLRRAFNNKINWDYSKFKGYPESTYFGYEDFNSLKKSCLKKFKEYYGDSLRKCRLDLI